MHFGLGCAKVVNSFELSVISCQFFNGDGATRYLHSSFDRLFLGLFRKNEKNVKQLINSCLTF